MTVLDCQRPVDDEKRIISTLLDYYNNSDVADGVNIIETD